jgi:hypothetical protein
MQQSGRATKGVVITVCVVVIALLLGGIGYWLASRDNAAEISQTNKQTETIETGNPEEATGAVTEEYCSDPAWIAYMNELIGLEFCYPRLWGATSLTPPQASESDAGSGYEIAFSAYDTVVSSITIDYQNTIGRGGRCEDPTNVAPDFSTYSESWFQDFSDPDLALARRSHIKQDGVFLISEVVDSFSGGLCYSATINQTGTAYPVVKIALARPLGEMTVQDHVANPEALFSANERTDFLTVVRSVRRPE